MLGKATGSGSAPEFIRYRWLVEDTGSRSSQDLGTSAPVSQARLNANGTGSSEFACRGTSRLKMAGENIVFSLFLVFTGAAF